MKEREADWRKYKFEQYKELILSIGDTGENSSPDAISRFAAACNITQMIGQKGVLDALRSLLNEIMYNSPLAKSTHDALISTLIWEIRCDLGTPGTPDASDFYASLKSSIKESEK